MAVDFGKQVGPLPLGAWIVVVAGGLGIAVYSRRQGNSAPVVVEDGSGMPGVGEGGSWMAIPPPTSAPPTAPQPTTNEEWGRNAINYLIAQGYDANVADAAIRKYLEADKLGIQEYALVRVALMKLGSPPVPLPPPPEAPTVPPPTPPVVVKPPTQPVPKPPISIPIRIVWPKLPPLIKPPPPPVRPAIRIHIVSPWPTKGSTLWGISEIYYGTGTRWPDIHRANIIGSTRPDGSPGFISNPNYLRPGDRIWVP